MRCISHSTRGQGRKWTAAGRGKRVLTILDRGFAAKAPQKIIESVSAWSTSQYQAVIEEDQIVTISNHIS